MKTTTLYETAEELLVQGQSDLVKRSAVIELLASTPLLGVLPFTLWRDVDAALFPDLGAALQAHRQLRIAGGDIAIDPEKSRMAQEVTALKNFSRWLTRVLIQGDHARDPREFDGLIRRASSHRQGVSILTLDEALRATPGATHLLMSDKQRNAFKERLIWTLDKYGRRTATYVWSDGEVPVLITGKDERDEELLPTGVLVLRLGAEGVTGVQESPPQIAELGPAKTRVSWLVGLLHKPDSITYLTE